MRESALKWRREERDMKHMNIETLMDILDWFDDGLYDYLDHILLTKPTAKRASAGPCLSCANTRARWSPPIGARIAPIPKGFQICLPERT